MTEPRRPSPSSLERLRPLQTLRPRTGDDLWNWVRAILGVSIPREQVCEDHSAPFDAFRAAYFADSPIILWEASRGFGGKSFQLAVLSLTEQITLGADVTLLGGSGEQSKNIHTYMGELWDAPHAPTWMLETDPTRTETKLTNGARVKALTASQRSVRGPHPQRLRMDEIDEMDEDVFDAALGQTMGSEGVPPQIVCSSTHQHADGTMTEAKRRARERGFPVYEWCYRESMHGRYGWLTEDEVETKRATVPSVMWESEYELQEPAPESRAIDPDAVDAAFNPALGTWDGSLSDGEIRLIEPDEGELFYHGTDWAKEQDWTIITTFERRVGRPDCLAAWQRIGRRPWPLMVKAYNDRVSDYGGSSAHDATGVGNVVSDYLDVPSTGFDFRQAKRRAEMLSDYVAAIEDGQIEYPMIDWAYREHKFASYDQLYGSEHLPDSIAAGALAWWARRREKSAGGVALMAGV